MVTHQSESAGAPRLRRALGLWDLILYGLIVIQPTAPMPVYGVMSTRSHGYAVVTVLLAMVAMLFTAISYGRMASAYPSAGSAFTYVGREIHPALGYLTGWSMAMDYMLNPLICTILCSKFSMNFFPEIPYPVWVVTFVTLITLLNLQGIKTTARINSSLVVVMCVVIVFFLAAAVRYVHAMPHDGFAFFTRPFFDPKTFSIRPILGGTSLAVLTYIGFDGISTLSEEARNPRRDILLATVSVCLLTGLLASIEVYAAQLIWGSKPFQSDQVESAFALLSRQAGGAVLFQIINFTLLVANMGSGMGSQLAAGRLLYGMGRGNALPKSFFGAIEPKRRVPRNNIVAVGAFALVGAGVLEFFAGRLGGGAYEIGAQALNFGAFIAFMGVNAAAFIHHWRHEKRGNLSGLIVPCLGFLICGFIWFHLSRPALILGAVWMAAGITYGAFRTHGFRAELISFEIPSDEA